MTTATGRPQLKPGDLFERYRIDALLGRGGMGEVYRAFDSRLRRPVALKVLRREGDQTLDDVRRVIAEARAMAGVAHRNIVTVYDVAEHAGTPYFTMELLDGSGLHSWCGPTRGTLAQKLRWIRDIASAIGAVHDAGLLHRDVKPGNVVVASDGTIKLLDFGIAKRVEATVMGAVPSATLQDSPASVLMGTPRYMAAEQLAGLPASPASDQYAWGLVATELFTGVVPRPREDVGQVLAQAGVPPAISGIVQRTLRFDPLGRFPSMAVLVATLDRVAQDPSVGSGPGDGAPTAPDYPPLGSVPAQTPAPIGGHPTGAFTGPVTGQSGPSMPPSTGRSGPPMPMAMHVPSVPPPYAPLAPIPSMGPPSARGTGALTGIAIAVLIAFVIAAVLGIAAALVLTRGVRLFASDTSDPTATAPTPSVNVSPTTSSSTPMEMPSIEPPNTSPPPSPRPFRARDAGTSPPLPVDAGPPHPSPTPPVPVRRVRLVPKSIGTLLDRAEVDAQLAAARPRMETCLQLPDCTRDISYMCIQPNGGKSSQATVTIDKDGKVWQILGANNTVPIARCTRPPLEQMKFSPLKVPDAGRWYRPEIEVDILIE